MHCLNDSFCSHGYRCMSGYCHESGHSQSILILPLIGGMKSDDLLLHGIYFVLFLFGLINNLLALITFALKRIRNTIGGVYLISYTISNLIFICLVLINFFVVIDSKYSFVHRWTCHIYPYLSRVFLSTSIFISMAIAIENVLNQCFKYDKYRPRKRAWIVSLCFVLGFAMLNFDKFYGRYLDFKSRNHSICRYDRYLYGMSLKMSGALCLILPCLIHLICLIFFIHIRLTQLAFKELFLYLNYLFPSMVYILCFVINGCFRYWFDYDIRFHLFGLAFFYLPSMITCLIYVCPNHFYVTEFFQICFCLQWNRRRQVEEFTDLVDIWRRRTSLETIKTISNLNDICMESEIYKESRNE